MYIDFMKILNNYLLTNKTVKYNENIKKIYIIG